MVRANTWKHKYLGKIARLFDVYISKARLPSCYSLLETGSTMTSSVFLSPSRGVNERWEIVHLGEI